MCVCIAEPAILPANSLGATELSTAAPLVTIQESTFPHFATGVDRYFSATSRLASHAQRNLSVIFWSGVGALFSPESPIGRL
jgi:hypothetical protein